jgi:hypothetical protein
MTGKVFSITDFRGGLDTRRSPLAAPTGTLRILENAVINQGGEIEKRLAFVNVAHIDPAYGYVFGQGNKLHVFAVGTTPPPITPGTCPVTIVPHMLADPGESITELFDVEAYNDKFQVTGLGASGATHVWYDGAILQEVGATPARGKYSRTYKTKMYRTDDVFLRFSGTGDPSVTDPASTAHPGAGFINIAINDPDGETLQGMEVFYDKMAILARLMTQVWSLDPDPSNDTLGQVLRIGTLAPHSITQFGTGDILFLSDSGVRSLKALTINLAAGVSDVGSAIDLILSPIMRSNPLAAQNARGVVQPIYGRYWLHLDDRIYVLSYFPAGDITAWSVFTTAFEVCEWAVVENRLFTRDDAGNIYLYGGVDLATYDSSKVTVRTPHHSASEPTTNKRAKSVDVICTGQWSVSMGMIPNNTELFELCANIDGTTLGLQSIPFAGYGTHIGLHMEHQAPGPATISAIHFNLQDGWTK